MIMNKRFSTLLAGVALMGAVSVNAQQVPVTTKPAASVAALTAGDVVYLNYDASWQIDFTGAWTANSHKDSLIYASTPVAGHSKAHIDSLLFKLDYEKTALDYNGTATFEYGFTFTSKVGKFAFAKPAAGKKATAFLKTNGALNKWVLPAAYLTTAGVSASTYGYVPYVVASRVSATDDTPKTVYVLAKDITSGVVEVLEVEYDAALASAITLAKLQVNYNASTGIGTLVQSGSHVLYSIDGYKVSSLDINVSATNIEDALGYEKPSFKFAKNVSEGEDNLLAAYNWEYTSQGYLKAIGAKQEKTGRDLYLTVDTFYYDVPNAQNYKLALDTLPAVGAPADWTRNVETYKFDIKASFVKDSITVIAKNTPKVTGDYFAQDAAPIAVNANANEEIIVKKFGNKTVLTTRYSGDATETPSITPSEFPTWELIDTEIAQFTSGDVYVIYDMNKTKADKKTVNPDFGKALIIDNMEDRFTQLFVKTDKLDQTLPSHQWVALKKDNVNVYSFANRETGAKANASVSGTVGTALTDVQLYVVDAKENLYTYGSKADTIKMVKIDAKTLSPFDGYRVITKEEQMNKVFSLRFISDLLGDEAYVQQDADSTMTVAVGNKDNAAEVRFLNLYSDTIKIGVVDHQLTVVPYAIKVGRYFLAYDTEKKVYRFTTKQIGEAWAEQYSLGYEYRFVITKIAGGNIALVPYDVLYGSTPEKLAIDSQNGNAVRVALDSDLRHAFELTEPANRIFAEVLGNTDTTLVKVNFHSVENLGWKLAKRADDFLYEGVTELKAGGAEYEKAAFDFKLDTAYVNRPGNTMPLYYITYDAVRGDSVPVAHIHDNGKDHVCPTPLVNDTVSGKFLFMIHDSLDISRANDLKYGYTYNYNTYAKLQMVDAKHINDTLIVNRVNPVAADTLKAGEIADNATVEQMQSQWLNYDNKALFAFRVNMDNAEEYAIYNPATELYLTYLNGFVVATTEAAFYTLKDEAGNNVANEEIESSASAVTVIAGEGQVTIAGAQGKKVVISNILGQVVANTVITSDNASIAAPQGVVIVAVAGEEAVKTIVK